MRDAMRDDSLVRIHSTAILSAYADLKKRLESPDACGLEDLQSATEYLLDKIKEAKRVRAETLLR